MVVGSSVLSMSHEALALFCGEGLFLLLSSAAPAYPEPAVIARHEETVAMRSQADTAMLLTAMPLADNATECGSGDWKSRRRWLAPMGSESVCGPGRGRGNLVQ